MPRGQHRPRPLAIPVTKLPFVGDRPDGRMGFWVLPAWGEDANLRVEARTLAAWFLLYAEVNGADAAQDLLDRIEREMPSRHPQVDRIFLNEVLPRMSLVAA